LADLNERTTSITPVLGLVGAFTTQVMLCLAVGHEEDEPATRIRLQRRDGRLWGWGEYRTHRPAPRRLPAVHPALAPRAVTTCENMRGM
jgi:hypothetical protein